jgi:hypothetical protein
MSLAQKQIKLSERARAEGYHKGTFQNPFSLDEILAKETGKMLPVSVLKELKKREKRLKQQTQHLIHALSETGIKSVIGYLDKVYLVTGHVERIEVLRNINFLPLVAQKNRRVYKNDLLAFLSSSPRREKYTHYAVITTGPRIGAFEGLGKEMSQVGDKIRRWAHGARRDFGIEVYCRIWEFPRDKDGTYHLHANVLYNTPFMSKKQREDWYTYCRKCFGAWWRDNGKIENINEIVKYPFKPESLADIHRDPAEVRWLYDELFNRRIFTAFGEFKQFRKVMKKSGKKINIVNGKVSYQYKERFVNKKDKSVEKEERRDAKDAENIILAITAPQFLTPFKEPVAIVKNLNMAPFGEKSMERLADLLHWKAKAQDAWVNNGAPSVDIAKNYQKSLETADNLEILKTKTTSGVYSSQKNDNCPDLFNMNTNIIEFKTDKSDKFTDPPPKPAGFLDIFD